MSNFNFTITQEKLPNINEILTVKERTKRMKGYLPPFLISCDLISKMIEAQAKEIVEVHKLNYELFLQLYPQTCTWSINLWEEMCGIPINDSLSIEVRRAKLLAKLTQFEAITPDYLRYVVSNFTKNFILTMHNKNYYFEVNVDALYSDDEITLPLKSTVEYAKPAHLGWGLVYSYYFRDKDLGNLVTYKNKLYNNQEFTIGNNPREYDDDFNILDGDILTFDGAKTFGDSELFVGRTNLNRFIRMDGSTVFDGTYLFSGTTDKLRHSHIFNMADFLVQLNNEYPTPSQDNNVTQDNVLLNSMALVVRSNVDKAIHNIEVIEEVKSTFDGSIRMDGSSMFDGWRRK